MKKLHGNNIFSIDNQDQKLCYRKHFRQLRQLIQKTKNVPKIKIDSFNRIYLYLQEKL